MDRDRVAEVLSEILDRYTILDMSVQDPPLDQMIARVFEEAGSVRRTMQAGCDRWQRRTDCEARDRGGRPEILEVFRIASLIERISYRGDFLLGPALPADVDDHPALASRLRGSGERELAGFSFHRDDVLLAAGPHQPDVFQHAGPG